MGRRVKVADPSFSDGARVSYERVNAKNELIVSVDGSALPTGAATAAKQDLQTADLDTIATQTGTPLKVPTTFRAVTPSDSTDISATATKGLLVTVTGLVYVQGTGDSTILSLGTIPAGTVIPGAFLHVGASTTATVVQMGG